MGQRALVLAVLAAGGCSIFYNPDKIPKPTDAKVYLDAPPPDTEIVDAPMPQNIVLDGVYPPTVDEGTGVGTSRPAIVILHGAQFARDDNLTVTFAPPTAVTLVDATKDLQIAGDHNFIVLALQVPVDMTCGANATIPVTITVTEDGPTGPVMVSSVNPAGSDAGTSPTAFAVHCLPEATKDADLNPLAPKYSMIDIDETANGGALDLTTLIPGARAILHSASEITINGSIDASASGQAPGPGGGKGGDVGSAGDGPGAGGPGANGVGGLTGQGGGGGGGFLAAGSPGTTTGLGGGKAGSGGAQTGDLWISSYAATSATGNGNQSSGGGGGSVGTGGGGGGTVELTAMGNVSVGDIAANGDDGTGTSGGGGGGTGGVIVLRSGATLTAGSLSVNAGMPGSSGGASSDGRMRVDAAHGTPPNGAALGPMFVDAPTLVTNTQTPTVNMIGSPSDSASVVKVYDAMGNVVANMTYTPQFGMGGTGHVNPTLEIGYNLVCVFVAGNSDPRDDVGTNCIEIGYAP